MTPQTVDTAGKRPAVELVLAPIDLQRWDQDGSGELVAVYLWTDVRPLRGAAGLVDWRLSGKLSQLIQSGRLTGANGEQLLLPTGRRLPWPVVTVLGLGARTDFSTTRFRAAVRRFLATMRGLGVHDIALAPPGRDLDALPARQAVELLLGEIRADPHREWCLRRLTVIEAALGHKDLADLIAAPAGMRRRGR